MRSCSIIAGPMFLLAGVFVNAQTVDPGTYNGWAWDEVGETQGFNHVAEQCSSALTISVDAAGNWSNAGSNERCRGRVTTPTGNFLFSEGPFTYSDTGTRPFINAGGLLFEVYGQDDDEPQEGEFRFGTALLNSSQSFGMFTTFAKIGEIDEVERQTAFFIDRPDTNPTLANVAGTWQFGWHSKEDDVGDELFIEQGMTTVTLDGQGGCVFSIPTVTGGSNNLDYHEIDYRTLSASGDVANRELRYTVFEQIASNCSYVITPAGDVRLTIDIAEPGEQPETDSVEFQVSDDFRFMIGVASATHDGEEGILLAVKGGTGKTEANVDGTFLINTVMHGFAGSGTGAFTGSTEDQEEFLFQLGAVTFDSTTSVTGPAGVPGWSACDIDVRNHEWAHQMEGNPAASGVENFTQFAQVDSSPLQCAYQLNADGGMVLWVEVGDSENSIELNFFGYVDASDEVLFLESVYSEAFAGPLWNYVAFYYITGIRYTGDLTADADGDGIDNLGEFQFPDFSIAPYTKLLPLPDVNGNGSPDFALVVQDTVTGQYRIYVKDTTTTDVIQEITVDASQAIDGGVTSDVSGGGSPEIAVLSVDSADDTVHVRTFDAATGTEFRDTTYAPAYRPMAMGVIPDINGGTTPAIGVLGVNAAGEVRVQVKRVGNGALVSNVTFAPNFPPKFLAIVPDVTGNNVSELAVLGIDVSGTVRVQLKDSATGTLKHWIQYARTFTPVDMAVVPDADGAQAPAVSVLAVNAVDGRVRVQTKFAETRMPVGTGFINFAPAFEYRHFTVVPDLNGNNVSELAYLGVDGTGTVRTQIKDTAARTLLRQVFFAKTFPPDDFVAMDDVNGNSIPEVAVVGTNPNNGNTRVQVKDSLSAAEVSVIFVP